MIALSVTISYHQSLSVTIRYACRRYEETLRVFFDKPVVYLEDLPHTQPLCFQRLIAGHASAYSLKYQFARGEVLRRFRNEICRRACALSVPQDGGQQGVGSRGLPPSGHQVLVIAKDPGYALVRPAWRNGCLQTQLAVEGLECGRGAPRVACMPSVVSLSLRRQIEMIDQVRTGMIVGT